MASRGRPKGSKNTVIHKYSDKEKEYLEEIIPGHTYREIQALFNNKFKVELTIGQIKGAVTRATVNTGLTGYFKKGYTSFNKGKKQEEYLSKETIEKMKRTQFKKGHTPSSHREVGEERINVEGYIEIKTHEPNTWKLKQRVMYEKYHNIKLSSNDIILFADRNKRNFSKENLILVTRSQLLKLNQLGYIKEDADLTKTGLNIVKLIEKIKGIENGCY